MCRPFKWINISSIYRRHTRARHPRVTFNLCINWCVKYFIVVTALIQGNVILLILREKDLFNLFFIIIFFICALQIDSMLSFVWVLLRIDKIGDGNRVMFWCMTN